MTELSQAVFDRYQVRKTKKQKLEFIRFLQAHIPTLQVQTGGLPKNRNLIIGDPATAKVILSAHYDTCARLPFPNFITPKCPLLAIGYSILVVIPYLLLVVLLNLLLSLFHLDGVIHYLISVLTYCVFMWLMLSGPANRHTANDNTSGVITLLELYQQMDEIIRQQVCFVFFDNEEQGLLGSRYFRKKYKKHIRNTLLVNFDCVSDGDHFLVALSGDASRKYRGTVARAYAPSESKQVLLENLKRVYYPSDQAGFPQAVAVAALKYKKPFGYYMDRIHTRRDTAFDAENIRYLTERTLALIRELR